MPRGGVTARSGNGTQGALGGGTDFGRPHSNFVSSTPSLRHTDERGARTCVHDTYGGHVTRIMLRASSALLPGPLVGRPPTRTRSVHRTMPGCRPCSQGAEQRLRTRGAGGIVRGCRACGPTGAEISATPAARRRHRSLRGPPRHGAPEEQRRLGSRLRRCRRGRRGAGGNEAMHHIFLLTLALNPLGSRPSAAHGVKVQPHDRQGASIDWGPRRRHLRAEGPLVLRLLLHRGGKVRVASPVCTHGGPGSRRRRNQSRRAVHACAERPGMLRRARRRAAACDTQRLRPAGISAEEDSHLGRRRGGRKGRGQQCSPAVHLRNDRVRCRCIQGGSHLAGHELRPCLHQLLLALPPSAPSILCSTACACAASAPRRRLAYSAGYASPASAPSPARLSSQEASSSSSGGHQGKASSRPSVP